MGVGEGLGRAFQSICCTLLGHYLARPWIQPHQMPKALLVRKVMHLDRWASYEVAKMPRVRALPAGGVADVSGYALAETVSFRFSRRAWEE